MANYTYYTVTRPVTIEVDEYWAAILEEEDDRERRGNRRHSRSDHKYAGGAPLALDVSEYEGDWLADPDDAVGAVELSMDLQQALRTLTELQRRYFLMNRIDGYSCAEIARREGRNKSTVSRLVDTASEKIKSFFN